MGYLVITAAEFEIDGIAGWSRDAGIDYSAVGVGLFESQVNLSMMGLTRQNCRGVVLAGTAGSQLEADLFKTALVDHFFIPEGIGEVLPDFITDRWGTIGFLEAKEGLRSDVQVFSSNGLTRDPKRFSVLPLTSWENMEAAGLSYYCYRMGIPFHALLYCTNTLSDNGRMQWRENHQHAGEVLLQKLQQLFEGLG